MTPGDSLLVSQLQQAAERYAQRAQGTDHQKADICRDIAARTLRFGRFASERQRSYAEALVRWSMPTPATTTVVDAQRQHVAAEAAQQRAIENSNVRSVLMSGTTLARIVQLMRAAMEHGLRFPKIRLQRGEWKIRIYPASRNGTHAGNFYVKANRLYCGRIDNVSGRFLASRDCPLDVIEALREFNADPRRVATAYGHATSNCCFCGRPLTDARSVAMGYGPICAEHYGLEWGEQRAAQQVSIDQAIPVVHGAAVDEQILSVLAQQRRRAVTLPPRRGTPRIGSPSERQRRWDARPVPTAGRPSPAPVHTPTDDDEDSHFM